MKPTIFLSVIFFASAFGGNIKPHIIDGSNASITDFPHQISLQIDIFGYYVHQCGGAILSPNWVITAAHCVSVTLAVSRIIAGATDLSNNNEHIQERPIDLFNVVIHPDFHADEKLNDLALLRVAKPFEFNDFVQPAVISKVPCISDSEINYFSGYGLTNLKGASNSAVLQAANLTAIPHEECIDYLEYLYGGTADLDQESQFCTIGPKGPCLLDDGSPLIQDKRLIGILSWLPSVCSTDKIPVIFQRIGNYVDFIRQHVDDLPI